MKTADRFDSVVKELMSGAYEIMPKNDFQLQGGKEALEF